MNESPNHLWVIHMGNSDIAALKAKEEGFVAIGWAAMNDLSRLVTRDDFRAALEATHPEYTPNQVTTRYGQLYRFVREIKIGDPVVFPVKPTREIAVGEFTGPYRHSDDPALAKEGLPNVRDVKWIKIVPRTAFTQTALYSFGSALTVSTSDDYLDEVRAVLQGEEMPTVGDVEEEEEENLYETAVQQTEDYLLKQWQGTGADFEHVVGAVLSAIGYTVKVTQASGDKGVDVIAHPDPLGLERPYVKVQVKSGVGSVGGPMVQQLKGTLQTGEKGMLVSLGKFTNDALELARNSPDLVLIDGTEFVRLFLDHYDKLDAKWQSRYPLKRVYMPQP